MLTIRNQKCKISRVEVSTKSMHIKITNHGNIYTEASTLSQLCEPKFKFISKILPTAPIKKYAGEKIMSMKLFLLPLKYLLQVKRVRS